METVLFISVGIAIGAIIGFLVTKGQKSSLEAKNNALSDEVSRIKGDNDLLKNELSVTLKEKQELSTRCEVLVTQKDNIESKANEDAEKARQERLQLEQSYNKQLKDANTSYSEKCNEIKERYEKEQTTLNDTHKREVESMKAEHEKSIGVIKEHQQKEVATLKSSFEESKANWQSERESITANNQKLITAKETECQKAIDVLKSRYEQEIENLKAAHEEADRNWQAERTAILAHNAELLSAKEAEHKSVLAAQEKRHNEAVQSMRETFAETIEHLKANLKSATEDMLKLRQEEFTDINKKNMQGIVAPLNETIAKMKLAMEGYSKEQNEFSGSMKTNIQTIIQQTETARQSAVELTTALKHDSKMQGDYGEAILDEILGKQGFTEGIHYELQYVMKDEAGKELKGDDGKGLRPDVLFHIDTVRDVIIDSKVNLTDFINFANAETPEERKMYLERHVKSIEKQVQLLSSKNYFKYHKKTSSRMDYVIMFVPISAAWWEALRYKPDLWREAMESNVYIADEQTLFAALRIIKLTWTQIAQVNTQKEIFNLADEMVKRVGMFLKSYEDIGNYLKKASEAYEDGEKKLAPKGYSILTTAEQLIKKGAKEDKKYKVSRFLDVDDIEALPAPVAPSDGEIESKEIIEE